MTRRALVLCAFLLVACSDEDARRASYVKHVLRERGYDDVETNGHLRRWACKPDAFMASFSAVTPSGRRVEGVACRGADDRIVVQLR